MRSRPEGMKKQLSYSKSSVNFSTSARDNSKDQVNNLILHSLFFQTSDDPMRSKRTLQRTFTSVESRSSHTLADLLSSPESSFRRSPSESSIFPSSLIVILADPHFPAGPIRESEGNQPRGSHSTLEPLDLELVENVSDVSGSLHSFGDDSDDDNGASTVPLTLLLLNFDLSYSTAN